jgi:hypothetical protein
MKRVPEVKKMPNRRLSLAFKLLKFEGSTNLKAPDKVEKNRFSITHKVVPPR